MAGKIEIATKEKKIAKDLKELERLKGVEKTLVARQESQDAREVSLNEREQLIKKEKEVAQERKHKMDLIQTLNAIEMLMWFTKWLPSHNMEEGNFRQCQEYTLRGIIIAINNFDKEEVKVMKILLKNFKK